MTDGKDFVESVRDTDRTLAAVHIPAGASHRIRTAIREGARPGRPRGRWLAGAILVASAAAIAILVSRRPSAPIAPAPSASSTCITTAAGDAVDLTGPCTLTLPTMQIETSGTTTLSETADGVRVTKGSAVFQVRRVPAGHAPVRVRVSGGVIEIVGTKFVVEQRDGGGSIQLLEGTVRFVFASGRVSIMHAGERLSWVDAPPSSSAPEPAPSGAPSRVAADDARAPVETPAPSGAPSPFAGVDPSDPFYDEHPSLRDALRRFEEIEREARYTEAERLREKLEPASFEVGSALEGSHVDPARVCAHWRWHTKRFPAGIYNGDIEARMRKLGCSIEH
jgi:hypothetical protein